MDFLDYTWYIVKGNYFQQPSPNSLVDQDPYPQNNQTKKHENIFKLSYFYALSDTSSKSSINSLSLTKTNPMVPNAMTMAAPNKGLIANKLNKVK